MEWERYSAQREGSFAIYEIDEKTMETSCVDIDALKPGPETDALVAEALGCKVLHTGPHVDCPYCGCEDPLTHGNDPEFASIKPYSSDWGAAMEALESVPGWWGWNMEHYNDCKRSKHVIVNLHVTIDGQPVDVSAVDFIGPLAVCKAILKRKAADAAGGNDG
jgi:hypothetical protein